jgi:hypothetical protein
MIISPTLLPNYEYKHKCTITLMAIRTNSWHLHGDGERVQGRRLLGRDFATKLREELPCECVAVRDAVCAAVECDVIANVEVTDRK